MTANGHAGGLAGAMVAPAALAKTTVSGAEALAFSRPDLSTSFTDEQRRLILDTCCGGASEAEARVLIGIAQVRGLNPLLGECFFVKRWDSETSREKWAVQASIDSFRIKAEQTGLYAGQDEPEYEYDKEGLLVLARVRVYRRDWTRPAVGVARYVEYVQTKKNGDATRFWQRMPHNQLSKCAEALALRKGFPAVLAKLYISEEMQQADSHEERNPAQPYVVREPESSPRVAQPDLTYFADLCDRIDLAESGGSLSTIARDAQKAHQSGRITDAHLDTIKMAGKLKRSLVDGKPAPPPSEPRVDTSDSQDGAA